MIIDPKPYVGDASENETLLFGRFVLDHPRRSSFHLGRWGNSKFPDLIFQTYDI